MGLGGLTPTTFATGYLYAGMGYTTVTEAAVPVLSANTPFATCTATNVTAGGGTLAYYIVCPGRDAARAHAVYALAPDRFAGRVAMVMGAKNMTMTEVQHARRIGDCAPAVRSSATRY